MRLIYLAFFAILCVAFHCVEGANGADWPQWRGPARNGKADAQQLLSSWPEGGPPLLWRSEGVGRGFSSLAVVDDAIYTMGDIDGQQCVVAASRDDGRLLWKTEVGPQHDDSHFPGPRSTPTYSEGRLYSITTDGMLSCIQAADGNIVWTKHLVDDFGGFMARGNDYDWKFSESPLIDGDRVVVTPGAPQALIVALQKTTGEEIWRTVQKEEETEAADAANRGQYGGGVDGAGYSSIVISHAQGIKQYVTLTGHGVVGIAAEDGEYLWCADRVSNRVANIPTPVVSGDHIFAASGYNSGGGLINIIRNQGKLAAEQAYFNLKFQNHHGGMILHDGNVYMGSGWGKGFPLCVDLMSGKAAWGPIRNDGSGSAALTMADGHLYFRYQDGLMVLVEATSEEYREKGSFMIPDAEDPSFSHHVIAGQHMYLRDHNHLYCYDLSRNDNL